MLRKRITFSVLHLSFTLLLFPLVGLRAQQKEKKHSNEDIGTIRNLKEIPFSETNSFYIGNKAPLQPSRLIKLPIGSIQPKGWLNKYLQLQRDGLTGHLGEISAWLNKENNAWLSKDGKGEYGWEEVPYWLKGYGNLGYILNDPKIIQETKVWLDAVLNNQRSDGYFGPVMMKDGKPDLWGNMIMLWCLQSYFDYSNDRRVLEFMEKYFQWEYNLPDSLFLKDYWENSRGGDNLVSVYWLYNRTENKPWLLDLAKKIDRNTANWRQKDNLPNWHNVNVVQSFREPATYYLQSGLKDDLAATYNDFNLIRNIYGNVPGGMFGADENARKGYDDPRQGVETCGMVEQMASDEILLGITGDPFWADNAEDVAFNTYPAAVMPDFKGLRYITSPNMSISDSKNHHPGIDNSGPFLMMNPFSSRCCQHNHSQGWPYFAEHTFMATPDNGVAAILYSEAIANVKVGKGEVVSIESKGHYPFDEKMEFVVNTKNSVDFPLYLRIPKWCMEASIKINGKSIKQKFASTSYIQIRRLWKQGDKVELTLPMELKVREWPQNKNSISIDRGPLTYSLKIQANYIEKDSKASAIGDSKWQKTADASKWPSYEIYPASAWNYGLPSRYLSNTSTLVVEKKPWPKDDFPFAVNSVPISIKAKGKVIPDWKIDQYGLTGVLPTSPSVQDGKEQSIELIPMGAARLRISSFPVVK
ncbi:MAG: hypothetical protein DI598_11315 [Pseudopedobacter saltans]|uniref:DUF1680 family protein n=1 Tax=Pseudopedobacter saltans TaxID=151895 RepID=A0A2W5GV25_9SPHI|nr:MAG: hypothetical protein DI598_11315 [Pseudopedobacter saltans]